MPTGKKFKSKFIQAGLANYPNSFGVALIRKESFDKFINTLEGKPVIINHKDVIKDNFKDIGVGTVCNVWYNPEDGWYWCDGVITDETAINLIKDKGWSVSCSYNITLANDEGGLENNIHYDIEFLDGIFTHLAIVNNPRYERANIVLNSKTEMVNTSIDNGGVGSGDFNHAGRPGEVGGSEPAGTGRGGKYSDGKRNWVGAKPDKTEQKPKEENKQEKAEPEKEERKVNINGSQKTLSEMVLKENFKPMKQGFQYVIYKDNKYYRIKPSEYDYLKSLSRKKTYSEKPKKEFQILKSKEDGKIKYSLYRNGELQSHSDDYYKVLKHKLDLQKDSKETQQLKLFNALNTIIDTYTKNAIMNRKEEEREMALLDELKKLVASVENAKDIEDDDCNKVENEHVDKRKLIDEVGGILKDKVDDEIIRTIIGKIEKVAYEKSEAKDDKADNEKDEEKEKAKEEKKAEDEKKVEELEKDVKKDVENKCKNSIEEGKVENAKEDYFTKLYSIYNASMESPKQEHTTQTDRLEAGKKF